MTIILCIANVYREDGLAKQKVVGAARTEKLAKDVCFEVKHDCKGADLWTLEVPDEFIKFKGGSFYDRR